MNNYDNKDYTDIGILEIIIDKLELDELSYQDYGYQWKVLIVLCNEEKNKCGYRKTYFKEKEDMLEYIENYIVDLEWAKINEL